MCLSQRHNAVPPVRLEPFRIKFKYELSKQCGPRSGSSNRSNLILDHEVASVDDNRLFLSVIDAFGVIFETFKI